MKYRETEVKFYTADLAKVETRILSLGGQLLEPRTFEINLRFDTKGAELRREGRVLRLRRDKGVRLTYKDGGEVNDGVINRREIEFSVSDFESAKNFLEALGYEIVFIYEKYRTTYLFKTEKLVITNGSNAPEIYIMLDDLPFGSFVEIEGNSAALKPIAGEIGLAWESAIPESYTTLFEQLANTSTWKFRDLTFENFKTERVLPIDLGVVPADD